tara:strand:- start:10319 stop:10423 length:105 start_codon:yes stop_codon:yes gene_type:complete
MAKFAVMLVALFIEQTYYSNGNRQLELLLAQIYT